MISKELASLDAWLARAEEVLREGPEQPISPSKTVAGNAKHVDAVIPTAVFLGSLEELLDRLGRGPVRWVVIAEDHHRPFRYWQAVIYDDGSLWTEVVSNFNLRGDQRWGPADERALRYLGWTEPVGSPGRPNWDRVERTTKPTLTLVAARTARTLTELWGLEADAPLRVQLFPSPYRGDTPGGSPYVGAGEATNVAPGPGGDGDGSEPETQRPRRRAA